MRDARTYLRERHAAWIYLDYILAGNHPSLTGVKNAAINRIIRLSFHHQAMFPRRI